MTKLALKHHGLTDEDMVEVFTDDGTFVASVYPLREPGCSGVRVVTKHRCVVTEETAQVLGVPISHVDVVVER